jgi:hypothetical protein
LATSTSATPPSKVQQDLIAYSTQLDAVLELVSISQPRYAFRPHALSLVVV